MRRIQMSEALAEYEAHLRSRSLAPRTVKNHTQPLRRALQVWGDIQVSTVKPVHIDRLFAAGDWAPRTRNLYRSDLNLFFTWARHNEYMPRDFDPMFGWRNARVPKIDKMRLSVDEFFPLLDAVEHPRDRYCLALGLFTLIRGSEIQTVRVDDLDLKTLTVAVCRHKAGGDIDVLPVCEELRDETVRWLNWYRQDQGTLLGRWYLVPSKKPDLWVHRDGQLVKSDELAQLRPDQIMSHPYRVAQRALAKLGYPTKGEGEHTLRRSAARALADRMRSEGTDSALMRVASMLGHRDVRVTQHYIGWDTEKEQRDILLKGKTMFPAISRDTARLRLVREEQ